VVAGGLVVGGVVVGGLVEGGTVGGCATPLTVAAHSNNPDRVAGKYFIGVSSMCPSSGGHLGSEK
jgi:hypothetical protein